jgi:hypothetical protein
MPMLIACVPNADEGDGVEDEDGCNTPKSYLGELRKFPKDLKFQAYYNKVMN